MVELVIAIGMVLFLCDWNDVKVYWMIKLIFKRWIMLLLRVLIRPGCFVSARIKKGL